MESFYKDLKHYILDVSKYILTGVVLSAFFNIFKEKTLIAASIGAFLTMLLVLVAYYFHIKAKGKE